AAAGVADDLERFPELRSAVALQRPEYVTGQALAVQAHQRRPPGEGADEQRDMLLAVVRRAKRHDLRIGQAVERQLRPRDERDLRIAALRLDIVDRHADRRR